MANITIKEILSADKVSELVDKVNFNFDQLLVNGGGPVGPKGTTGDSGPQGITGTRWFTARDIRKVTDETNNDVVGNVNLPGYDATTATYNSGPPTQYQQQTGTSTVSGTSNSFASDGTSLKLGLTSKPIRGGDLYLEEDSTDAAKDGRVWEYDSLTAGWVLTNTTIRGPKGDQGDPGTQQFNRGVDAVADDVVYLPADTGGNATKLFIGNTVTLKPDGSTAETITDSTIKNHLPETGNSAAAITVHVGNAGVGDRIISMTHESYLAGSSSANANSSLLGRDPLAYSNLTMSSGGNLIMQGAFRNNNDGTIPSISINAKGNVVLSTSTNSLSLTLDSSDIEHKFSGGKLRITTSDSNSVGIRIGDDEVSGLSFARFETDNANGFYFGSTSSTNKKFIVDGNIHSYNSNFYLQSTFNTTGNAHQVYLKTNGQVTIGPKSTTPVPNTNSALSVIGDGVKWLEVQGSSGTTVQNNENEFLKLRGPGASINSVHGQHTALIESVGSNDPSLTYQINNNSTFDRFSWLTSSGNTGSANFETMVHTGQGYTGLGKWSSSGTMRNPNAVLHLRENSGNLRLLLDIDQPGQAQDAYVLFRDTQESESYAVGMRDNADMFGIAFSTGTDADMQDTLQIALEGSTGFVGIGTDTPSSKLHVMDSMKIDITSAQAGYVLSCLDSDGTVGWIAQTSISGSDDGDWSVAGSQMYSQVPAVGIGNTSPTFPLHVTGNTALDGQVVVGQSTFSSWNGGNYQLEVSAPSGTQPRLAIVSDDGLVPSQLTFNRQTKFTHIDTSRSQGTFYNRNTGTVDKFTFPEIDGKGSLGGVNQDVTGAREATVMFANKVNGGGISTSQDDYHGFIQLDMSKVNYQYALSTYNNPGQSSTQNDSWLFNGDGTNFDSRIEIVTNQSYFQIRPFNNRLCMVDFSITLRVTTSAYTIKYFALDFGAGTAAAEAMLPLSTGKDSGAGTTSTYTGNNSNMAAQHFLPGTFGWRQDKFETTELANTTPGNADYDKSIYGKGTGTLFSNTGGGDTTGYGLNFMGWRLSPRTTFSTPINTYPTGADANSFRLHLNAPNTNNVQSDSANQIVTSTSAYETSFYIDTEGTTFNGNAIVPIIWARVGTNVVQAKTAATFSKTFAPSDIRLKENYEVIGISTSGIPIYVFSYIGEAARYIGTMAQDLLNLGRTDAVTVADNGYYAVDYSVIDIDFELLK